MQCKGWGYSGWMNSSDDCGKGDRAVLGQSERDKGADRGKGAKSECERPFPYERKRR
jgi:hypothetical protein